MADGGSPTDDHDNDANITLGDLQSAADSVGITLLQVAANITRSAEYCTPPPIVDVAVPVEKRLTLPSKPKRFVLGVAYAANRPDGHGEWAGKEQLEDTAWTYVRKGRRIGFYHANGTEGHGEIVESYIYRGPDWTTTDISGRTQVIKSGDWMLGAVLDEAGFGIVLDEKADGWSIQGMAKRRIGPPPQ